jgi:hypothetical protein
MVFILCGLRPKLQVSWRQGCSAADVPAIGIGSTGRVAHFHCSEKATGTDVVVLGVFTWRSFLEQASSHRAQATTFPPVFVEQKTCGRTELSV